MSLTMGLAIVGGLLLIVVTAHGAWILHRHRQRGVTQQDAQGAAAPQSHSTAPLDAPRIDPQLLGDTVATDSDDDRALDSTLMHTSGSASGEARLTLDALIDAIALIEFDEKISSALVLTALPATRRVGSKPFFVEGRRSDGVWETPASDHFYGALQVGVQLANRSGALTEIEFSEFVQKAQAIADVLGGVAQFPDMRHEVARAKELDQFASTHDAQLSFTLRARAVAWSTGYVQQNVAKLGFVAGAFPGRMVLPAPSPGYPPLLTLNFDTQAALSDDPEQSALRSLELALDVAQVDRQQQPYSLLCDTAIALAASMDGLITDARGQVLDVHAMQTIGADLEHLYDMLDSRDLAAGSAQARRLFS